MSNPLSFEQFAACLAAVGASVVISACAGNNAPAEAPLIKTSEVNAPAAAAPAAASCSAHASAHGDAKAQGSCKGDAKAQGSCKGDAKAQGSCKGQAGCKAQGSCKGDATAASDPDATPVTKEVEPAPVVVPPAKPKVKPSVKSAPKTGAAQCGQGTCSADTKKKIIDL